MSYKVLKILYHPRQCLAKRGSFFACPNTDGYFLWWGVSQEKEKCEHEQVMAPVEAVNEIRGRVALALEMIKKTSVVDAKFYLSVFVT